MSDHICRNCEMGTMVEHVLIPAERVKAAERDPVAGYCLVHDLQDDLYPTVWVCSAEDCRILIEDEDQLQRT